MMITEISEEPGLSCYWMLHTLGYVESVVQHIMLVPTGTARLCNVRMIITDLNTNSGVSIDVWGEQRPPNAFRSIRWQRRVSMNYCISFGAGDRRWHQDLLLRRTKDTDLWVSATRLQQTPGDDLLRFADARYLHDFGDPTWTCTPTIASEVP